MWPYINGKALMSGVNLVEMDGSDMIDVLHYLFEEDSHIVSEESIKSRSGVRKSIYDTLYGVKYKYEYKDSKAKHRAYIEEDLASMDSLSDAESAQPFNPREVKAERKPTMGAETITQFDPYAENPFGGILDAPMSL